MADYNWGVTWTWLREKQSELGIALLGAVAAPKLDRFSGIQVDYEDYRTQKTTDYVPEARTVLVLGFHAWDEMCDLAVFENAGTRRQYLGEMMFSLRQRDLALALQRQGATVYAGYEKLSHKYAAQLAGLGSFGKNSLILTEEFGPRVRFRLIITDVEVQETGPGEKDWCGDCTRCLEACPMGALTPYQVDPQRCLVGRHLENHSLPPRLIAAHERQLSPSTHVMCGTCQAVCPYTFGDGFQNRA